MADRTLDGGSGDNPQGSVPVNFLWTLEVAVSGGGLRASAYTLGALLYLVHSGLNKKVTNSSSVSGGSITNAFVACNCKFGGIEYPEFREKIVGPLARKIAFSGLLQRWQSWIWGLAVVALALSVLCSLLALCAAFVGSWLAAMGLIAHPPAIVVYSLHALAFASLLSPVLILLFYSGSWPIDKWMGTIVPPNKTLGKLSDHSVDHVFCATDLNFGTPFFFSTADKGRLFSTLHGLSDAWTSQ